MVVSIDIADDRDEPEARLANGASVVSNTPAGTAGAMLSRSSFAVHAVPSDPARLNTPKAWLDVPLPCVSVPKSMSSDETVLPAANEPMAWSSTASVTACETVGFEAWGLVACTVSVPDAGPASAVFKATRCVLPPPRAASLPVPVPTQAPVPVKP